MRKRSAVITSVVLSGLLAGTAGSAQAAGDAPSLGARPVFLVGTGAVVDASTAAPVAARAGGAVLYADVDGLPAASADFLKRYAPSSVVIVGGERAVGAKVQGALAADYPVHRYGGADRQETAALLAGLAASLPALKGEKGDTGSTGGGYAGATGPGVPNGGLTDQVLKKTSGADQATAWSAASTPLSIGTFTGPAQNFPGQSAGNPTVTDVTFAASDASASTPPTLSGTNKVVTIAQDGFYELSGSVRLYGAASVAERYLAIQVSTGGPYAPRAEATTDRQGIAVLNASVTLRLTAGTTVKMVVLNNTSGTVAAQMDNPPRLSVVELPTTQPS